jgi:pilus assembly protein CpaE
MRAGVREVLPTPMAMDSFRGSINHARSLQVAPEFGAGVGRVLGVIGAKGGGGATFLATNLAFALSRLGKRVVVLDLNLYFGDAAIFLGDSSPKSTIVDVARHSQDLDLSLLEASMAKVSERLHLLSAPETPVNINVVSPVAIQQIINLARTHYDFVVLDMCALLDSTAVKALDMCETVNLVLQLNLPDIRAAKRMVRVFRDLGYDNDKINIMVNRYVKGGDIALSDVEKATMLKVSRVFPNSYVAVTASINQGIPLLELRPQDEVALALDDWAHQLVPGLPRIKPPSHSWFQNLMGYTK